MKRAIISVVAGAALVLSSAAFAASAPLAPGGAAGVKQAQEWSRIPVWGYVGGVLVIVGFIAVLTDSDNGHASGTTCFGPDGSNHCPSSGSTGSTH